MGNKVINKVGPKLGLYEIDTDEQLSASIGFLREMDDGRMFRLCRNSVAAALAPGLLVQAKADTAYSEELVVAVAGAVGDTTLSVTVTSGHEDLSENELRDGYFAASGTAGELGHGRKIKGNTAAVAGAITILTFYDALTDVITISSYGAWIFPIYTDVVVDAGSAKAIGCPICDVTISVAATGYYYFWAQVAGPCPIISGGALVAGDNVMSGGDGSVIATTGTTPETVGVAMQAVTASGDVGWIWLNIE